MSYQVYSIETPSNIEIPGGLHAGKQIIVRGRMDDGGDIFAINLQTEGHDDSNIAFHLNPRHSDKVVVRNHYEGDWGSEERDEVFFYPFGNRQDFTVRILVTDEEYKVYGDGHHMFDFRHRMSFHDVHYIGVRGDCKFYDIVFQDKLRTPYSGVIPGRFQVGKAIRVRGVVRESSGFSMNFALDAGGDQIAYHFNPRPEDEAVVRNSCLGDWGEEERDVPNFPFPVGTFFDLFFVGTDNGFTTFVNDEYFNEFSYRCSVEDCSHFTIQGDVEVADVQYFDQTREQLCKQIPSGLKKGDIITVRGFFPPGSDTFSVNLHHGLDSDSDIAFHFNPRRSAEQLVLNSCHGGDWGDEILEELPLVFRHEKPFELRILAKEKKLKVYCNGKYVAKFPVRAPILDEVQSISMMGDAYVHQIKLQREVVKPHTERIPGHINENQWISVGGTAKKESDQFAVNLQCGEEEDADLALHFNPRMGESVVVRNSTSGGDWHDEEREQPNFPFGQKDFFEIIINTRPEHFRTFVNGRNFVNMDHRVPYERICHVRTAGDANFFEPEYF